MRKGSENEPRKVGIWVRVSTEQQVLDEAPEVHEFRARAYAESRGWDVHRVYRLDAVSGKTIINHPITKEMLKAVEDSEIEALVFSKTARLSALLLEAWFENREGVQMCDVVDCMK